MSVQAFDSKQQETLENLCQTVSGLRPFYEIHGLIFALTSAPEIPVPSKWMTWVFFESSDIDEENADLLVNCLMSLFHLHANAQRSEQYALPDVCTFTSAEDESLALVQWCTGFLIGHTLVEDVWNVAWDKLTKKDPEKVSELESNLIAVLSAFSTFADVKLALEQAEEDGRHELKDNLPMAYEALPEFLEMYVDLAGQLVNYLPNQIETYTRTKEKIGRNDPCSCGSGKKYKKCCGVH